MDGSSELEPVMSQTCADLETTRAIRPSALNLTPFPNQVRGAFAGEGGQTPSPERASQIIVKPPSPPAMMRPPSGLNSPLVTSWMALSGSEVTGSQLANSQIFNRVRPASIISPS